MKRVIIKDKRYKGKKALLFDIKDNGDGSFDLITNDLITDTVEVIVKDENNDKVIFFKTKGKEAK